jgi:hypothetical protein
MAQKPMRYTWSDVTRENLGHMGGVGWSDPGTITPTPFLPGIGETGPQKSPRPPAHPGIASLSFPLFAVCFFYFCFCGLLEDGKKISMVCAGVFELSKLNMFLGWVSWFWGIELSKSNNMGV